MSFEIKAYATTAFDRKLDLNSIVRRDPGEHDIVIDILYCGVCHSDIHTARDEWGGTVYPCVPGHEIVGKVANVGSKVKRFKEGAIVGVGCLVDSCRKCASCHENLEQHCEAGPIFTYNSREKQINGITYGGYSENIVVNEDFVLSIPSNLDLAAAAPLLCAGITTYSPLKRFNVKKGQKVGIVGLGGLGHMAVKFANAFGSHVVVFTRSENKINDAKKLGAHEIVISTHEEDMKKQLNTFDFILDTVAFKHDIAKYLNLLRRSGNMVLVGAPKEPLSFSAFSLIFQRHQLAGSLIGGIKETQEMLHFCGKHNIVSEIEMINIDQINDAYERILKSDVKYRFVIDMQSLKKEEAQ